MHKIYTIAYNSFKESIRNRVLYAIFFFAIVIIGLSNALGGLSFTEHEKIITDFGLAGLHLSAIILSIFVGSSLLFHEFDKQTILSVLVRPLKRSQFLLGKYFGFAAVLMCLLIGLSLVLCVLLGLIGANINAVLFVSIFGIYMESLILLAFTFFFGSFTKPFLSICCTLGLCLIGHWQNSLRFFAAQNEDPAIKLVSELVSYTLPNLEHYNWKNLVFYNEMPGLQQLSLAGFNAFAWVAMILVSAIIIFDQRDCT